MEGSTRRNMEETLRAREIYKNVMDKISGPKETEYRG